MAKGTYITSDIYEAVGLIVYGCECKRILVDNSKDRSEALFKFDGSVKDFPQDYRSGKMLVDVKGFKQVMISLKKKMFEALDSDNK